MDPKFIVFRSQDKCRSKTTNLRISAGWNTVKYNETLKTFLLEHERIGIVDSMYPNLKFYLDKEATKATVINKFHLCVLFVKLFLSILLWGY